MDAVSLNEVKPNPNIPVLAPGDTVNVRVRVVEGDKERIQPFQGVVIRVRRGGAGASFTVRRIASHGVGVERTFPLCSPLVEKVEVIRHGKVRRAKLYYLRGRSAKASRIKERRVEPGEVEQAEAMTPEPVVEGEPESELEAAEVNNTEPVEEDDSEQG